MNEAVVVLNQVRDRVKWTDFTAIAHLLPSKLWRVIHSPEEQRFGATNQAKFPGYPESQTNFFLKVVDAEVEFVTDGTR